MFSHFNIEDERKKIQHCQHIMLYYFKKGKNAIEMLKEKLCSVWKGAVTDLICRKWFEKFHSGDLSLEDAPSLGRSEEVYSDQIKTLIENKHYTMWEIADILKISTSSAK